MKLLSQVVVLRVTYDAEADNETFGGVLKNPPSEWNWVELTDEPRAEVIGHGPVEEVSSVEVTD